MKVVRTYEFEPEETKLLEQLAKVQAKIEELHEKRNDLVLKLTTMGVTREAIADETGIPRGRIAYATQQARSKPT
jgi:DNA-directed RNA polymerase specialized sigma24 family protein